MQVVAPHFVAGAIFENGVCQITAPILRWAKGKTEDEVRATINSKGWQTTIIPRTTP